MRVKINKLSKKVNLGIRILTITMVFTMVIVMFAIPSFANDTELSLEAEGAFAISASTGEVIYELNPDKEVNPASIIKLMTAMVLIDNIKTNEEYDNKLKAENIYDDEDFILTVEDLVYLMLRNSSNEAANELAEYSKGSVDDFVSAMNFKAAEIGLNNTHFTTPSGIFVEGQYSTAGDIAELTKIALTYPIIKDALGNSEYKIKSMDLVVENKMKLLIGGDNIEVKGKERSPEYEGVYAAKSGTGNEDNMSSMIAGVVDDDIDIIVVVLGDTEESCLIDTIKLLDYSIKHVTRNTLIKENEKVLEIKVKHGAITKVDVVAATKGYVYLPEGASEKLITTVPVIDKNLKAPVKKGTVVGRYNIYIADELVGGVDLIVNENIKEGWFPSYIYISNKATVIIATVLFVLLIAFSILLNIRHKNLKRRREAKKARIKELAKRSMEMQEDRKRREWTYHK